MKQIFKPQVAVEVPDGTLVSSIFSNNEVSNEMMDQLSLAVGTIKAGVNSKIHYHPFVLQVTYVTQGKLHVKMKGPDDAEPYLLTLEQGDSCITKPLTFFQLINPYETSAEVLYIVNPGFLFDMNDDFTVNYNDALILEASWEVLAEKNWPLPVNQADLKSLAKMRESTRQRFIALSE